MTACSRTLFNRPAVQARRNGRRGNTLLVRLHRGHTSHRLTELGHAKLWLPITSREFFGAHPGCHHAPSFEDVGGDTLGFMGILPDFTHNRVVFERKIEKTALRWYIPAIEHHRRSRWCRRDSRFFHLRSTHMCIRTRSHAYPDQREQTRARILQGCTIVWNCFRILSS